MILYHGTNTQFDKVDLSKGRLNKDFGRGFYLSADRLQAEKIAKQRVLIEGGEETILSFEYDEIAAGKDPNIKILVFENYSVDWALFICKNRNTKHTDKQHNYDIVYGPIADDRVGIQIKLYDQKYITIRTLLKRLKYIKPTYQYYFGSDIALKYLRML